LPFPSGRQRVPSADIAQSFTFSLQQTDPKVQDYLKAHAPHLLNTPSAPSSADPSIAAPRPTFSHRASLGMLPRSDSPDSYSASSVSSSSVPPSSSSSTPPPKKTSSKLGSMFSKLSMNSGGSGSSTPPSADDVTFASNLHPHHEILPGVSTKLDSQLGPWRFADARSDAVEGKFCFAITFRSSYTLPYVSHC
jgi:hypothetical protein